MALFKRRSAPPPARSLMAWWLADTPGDVPGGYRRLIECPEIQGAIDYYAAVIGASTIYLMENRKDGDHRLDNRLSRKLDIDPWHGGTRQTYIAWIVSTMLGEGDGNAYVLPHYASEIDPEGQYGRDVLVDLEPMPGAVAVPNADESDCTIQWRGRTYASDSVLHFPLFPDTSHPWRGRGYRLTGLELARAIGQADALKEQLTSPDYKPPIVVYADVDTDFFSDEKREELRKKYLEENDRGKPWILPSGVLKAEQMKPLSLTDLAIKDTSELNRTAVATLFRMPPFLLGVGAYNRDQYNAWIKTSVLPICQTITQVHTRGLLENKDWYFAMPEKRIYSYTPMELVTLGLAMSDRGYLNGDEVRELAMMSPAGLTERRALENYIPYDMAALQNKLHGKGGGEDNA